MHPKSDLFSDFSLVYSSVSSAKSPNSQNKALISSNTLQEDGGLEKGKQSGGLERNVLCNMRRGFKKKKKHMLRRFIVLGSALLEFKPYC